MDEPKSETARLVVMTPIRNEARILRGFLQATTSWADVVLILDQGSEDESRSICREFPKVILFENTDRTYDEGWRQRFLIGRARELVPGPRVLFALDADEIPLVEESFCGWEDIRRVPPGTTLLFHKPDLLSPPSRCRERGNWFELGYSDDGQAHVGELIHSRRIPGRRGGKELRCEGLQVLHLARARRDCFLHRNLCYSMIERIKRTKSLRERWLYYAPSLNWKGRAPSDGPTPSSWLQGLKELGLGVDELAHEPVNPWTLEVLDLMARHGEEVFWWDDIWSVDWEAARLEQNRKGNHGRIPPKPIGGPPGWIRWLGVLARGALKCAYMARTYCSRKFSELTQPRTRSPSKRLA